MPSPTDIVTPTPPSAPISPSSAGSSKAIVALILGILSLVCCGFFTGIPAIFLGHSELKDIDAGRSAETNRTIAKLGFILGIIGTAISCLGTLVYGVIIALAVIGGTHNFPSTF